MWGAHERRWVRRFARYARGVAVAGTGLLASSAFTACLNDSPVTAGAPTVRAALHANVVSAVAGGTVRIRIGYRTSSEPFVALSSNPEQISVSPGTTVTVPVTVDIGPCLADTKRQGASDGGCLLTVELTLIDASGETIDTQTRDARSPATPGQAVDFGTVTIGVAVSSITVAPASLGMNVSDEQKLTATVRDASGAVTTTATVTWTTSDATVTQLTPAAGGSVTIRALKLGTASVTASAGGKTSAPIPVSVVPPAPLVITQRQGQGCVLAGQTINLDVTSPPGPITWSTGSPNVATVSSAGVVTGVSVGQSLITATSGNRTGSTTVCVTGPLRIANTQLTVIAGQTVQIVASGVTGGVLSYTSGATAIATVDANGLVRGVSLGQATITATFTAPSGSQSVPVQITVSPAGLSITPTSASAAVNGGAARLSAIPLDASGAPLPAVSVSWTISDASIGGLSATSGTTVDVRALKLGTATVRATLGAASAAAQFTATASLPAARLEKISGDNAVCPTRSTACTFVVRAVDVNGVPVPGATVTWSPNSGCGPSQSLRTDAFGVSTATNICSNTPAGTYTQTAALASAQVSVSFAFTLRGLLVVLQQIDNFGNYIYAVTSPFGPASGISASVEYRSGPVSNYVSAMTLNSQTAPATLTVSFDQFSLPFGTYTFDVVVSTTTAGIGPGVGTTTFTSDSSFSVGRPNNSARRARSTSVWRSP